MTWVPKTDLWPILYCHVSYLRLSLVHSDQRLISLNSSTMRIKLPCTETQKKLSLWMHPSSFDISLSEGYYFPALMHDLCGSIRDWWITKEGISWEYVSLSHAMSCIWYHWQVIANVLTVPSQAKSLMPLSYIMNMVIICLWLTILHCWATCWPPICVIAEA